MRKIYYLLVFCLYASLSEAQPSFAHEHDKKLLFEGAPAILYEYSPDYLFKYLAYYGIYPKEQKMKSLTSSGEINNFEFDSIGRIKTFVPKYQFGEISYNYDRKGNLIQLKGMIGPNNPSIINIEYDDQSRFSKIKTVKYKKQNYKTVKGLDSTSFYYTKNGVRNIVTDIISCNSDVINQPSNVSIEVQSNIGNSPARDYGFSEPLYMYHPCNKIFKYNDSLVVCVGTNKYNSSIQFGDPLAYEKGKYSCGLIQTFIIKGNNIVRIYEKKAINSNNRMLFERFFDTNNRIVKEITYFEDHSAGKTEIKKYPKEYEYFPDGRIKDDKMVQYDNKNMLSKYSFDGKKWYDVKYTYY